MPSYDPDTGDISLSLPSSSSEPQLASLLSDRKRPEGAGHRRDISSPTPSRVVPSRRPVTALAGPPSPSPSTRTSTPFDEDNVLTPIAGPSRPSSARIPAVAPTPTFTRLSNGVHRSRSLNVRLPSVDLSNNTLAPPSASPHSASSATPTNRLGFSRRPGEPRPPPLITPNVYRDMSRWVKEIVVCNFDLERGPVVERRIAGRRWGPGEKENVAFSSFPDTSLFAEGSIQFSFKIRNIPPDPSSLHHPEPPSPMPDRTDNPIAAVAPTLTPTGTRAKAEEYRRWDERGREWLYGYVWFEQKKDPAIVRGYMQKSLVVLSHLPFPSLFSAVLDRIAPSFFSHGYSALEAACHSIASWPDPTSDVILELPLLSDVLTVKLPETADRTQVGNSFGPHAPERPLLVSLPSSTPLRAFATFLPALWSLWECLILAEPILVIAPDPRRCSEIVWWLRDMMRPIPPAGDFRPYLHIHDHDFSLLVNSNKPQAGVVVGVTNPFFRNAASHWPNVIVIPSDRRRPGASPMPNAVPEAQGFISRRHRSVQKDRTLLKRLEQLAAEGNLDEPSANEAIRTHFQQLTERFLVPLNRYFQTLIPPSPNSGQPNGAAPALKPFSLPAFLAHLKTHGPNPLQFRTKGLSTKSRVENDFYAAFGMSASFSGWLAARIESLGVAVASKPAQTLGVPSHRPIPESAPSVSSSVSLSTGFGTAFSDPFGGPAGGTMPKQKEVGLGIRPSASETFDPASGSSQSIFGRLGTSPTPRRIDNQGAGEGSLGSASHGAISVELAESDREGDLDDTSSNSHWRPSEESLSRQFQYADVFGGVGAGVNGARRGSEGMAVQR